MARADCKSTVLSLFTEELSLYIPPRISRGIEGGNNTVILYLHDGSLLPLKYGFMAAVLVLYYVNQYFYTVTVLVQLTV